MCRFWIAILSLSLTSISVANATTVTQEQLHQLTLRIQQLQTQMHNTRTQYGRLQRQLQNSEEDIGEIARRLETLHSARIDKENTLADLENQQITLQTQLKTQRQVLAQQVRAAYIMGQQDYLKLWLNQEYPVTIGRVLTYYDYFNRARSRQISSIKTILQRLNQLHDTIELETTDLNQLVKNHTHKKAELEINYQERHKILGELAKTLESQSKQLKRLQEDKRHLETLLGTLGEAIKNIPQSPKPMPFAKLKGQLAMPVKGRVLKQFGEQLVSHLKWQGMLIAAKKGEKVQVVASGRVVFAQWFRNLGLLVIVDHAKGYMSLYAHNQSLYTKTGDWVKAHDIIASVGNSGGRKISALYFEIRHQGEPQAPRKWLRDF
ncbi:MAG: peptidoglycan DD-metalloendopeptidase family protein [Candidatus Parabeggiatoa sp.]|nr:peptidoglycan DD-metalloendopeptidase family protein [Candidatus Parabeggiatoa sp.]